MVSELRQEIVCELLAECYPETVLVPLQESVSGGWNGIDPCNSLISVKCIDGCLIGLAFAFRETCDKNVAVYEALLD
jgi:hypothetical protein